MRLLLLVEGACVAGIVASSGVGASFEPAAAIAASERAEAAAAIEAAAFEVGDEADVELQEERLIQLEAAAFMQMQARSKRTALPHPGDSPLPERKEEFEFARHAIEAQHEAALRRESELAAQAPAPPGGVLHFLFMGNDGLPLASYWQQFFAKAHPGSWRAWLHCMNLTACEQSPTLAEIPDIKLVPTVSSEYCVDLQAPMVELLKHAVMESAQTSGAIQKFIFLSDTTLPVKPFQYMYDILASNGYSDFCFQLNWKNSRWPNATIHGMDLRLVKHSQWVVLSQHDAVTFMKTWTPGGNFDTGWQVPLGLPAGEGVRFFVPDTEFERVDFLGGKVGCIDEFAFFNTIYSAFHVDQTGTHYYEGLGHNLTVNAPRALTSQGRCRTFTGWDPEYPDEPGRLLANALDDSDSNVTASAYPQDLGDVLDVVLPIHRRRTSPPKFDGSPATFNVVSAQTLAEFRHSTFLFARKFARDVVLEDFEQIVLSQ